MFNLPQLNWGLPCSKWILLFACWVIFHPFFPLLIFFSFKQFFQEYHQSGPDLGPNCLYRSSADHTSRQRVKVGMVFGKVYSAIIQSYGPVVKFYKKTILHWQDIYSKIILDKGTVWFSIHIIIHKSVYWKRFLNTKKSYTCIIYTSKISLSQNEEKHGSINLCYISLFYVAWSQTTTLKSDFFLTQFHTQHI